MALKVTRQQAIRYRLIANNLTERLSPGEYVRAARNAIQDTYPRSALLSLHARVAECEPTAWEDPGLVQLYSPRAAVHILPAADRDIFTVGRLPLDPAAREKVDEHARLACAALRGSTLRGRDVSRKLGEHIRRGSATGRIGIRWDTRSVVFRELPSPEIDATEAGRELCRRHIHAFGPTTPLAFAWWAGMPNADAGKVWQLLAADLTEVNLEGHSAWILAEDEAALRTRSTVEGVRLLPAEELRLFGRDRTGLFIAPMRQMNLPLFDTFHPHGVVVNGEVIGSWGRRGGRVNIRVGRSLRPSTKEAIEAEAAAFPIPGAKITVEFAVS